MKLWPVVLVVVVKISKHQDAGVFKTYPDIVYFETEYANII